MATKCEVHNSTSCGPCTVSRPEGAKFRVVFTFHVKDSFSLSRGAWLRKLASVTKRLWNGWHSYSKKKGMELVSVRVEEAISKTEVWAEVDAVD